MIIDESGIDSFKYLTSSNNLSSFDIFSFLDSNNIDLIVTKNSTKELVKQPYFPCLFAGEHVIESINHKVSQTSASDSQNNLGISSFNLTLTSTAIDQAAYPISVCNPEIKDNLWSYTKFWPRLSEVDKSILYVCRSLSLERDNFFVLVNDNDLIYQLDFEGFSYLRNSQFLKYMTKNHIISSQKGVAGFGKWSTYDPQWIKKDTTFKDI
ncbi:MAG: hypothetical protein U9M90_02665 [Patescibacteria group bacterium]|nr:hypothetical protein [Patescibacteria group bacterium]